MNKLKQAIAYLVGKIQTTYYAARFLIAVILQESPYGHERLARESLRGGVCGGHNAPPDRDLKTDSSRPAKPIREPKAVDPETMSEDEFLGFWAGNPLDRFYYTDNVKSRDAQRFCDEALQDEATAQQCVHEVREWDLLEPRDRQAIILHAMWQYQAEFDYHQLFSVHLVMVLCDRPEMQWEQTFDDLVVLKYQEKLVLCETHDDRGKKFYGFLWGVK